MTEEDLRALIDAHPVEGTPEERRAAFRGPADAAGATAAAGFEPEEVALGGVRCLRLTPTGAAGAPIVWLHGGGYVFGAPETHLAPAGLLARAGGRSVILPDYPLAPERPWPAQREAAAAVAAALGEVVLAGDSAGGHLAIAAALEGRAPEALILFSPNTSRAYGLSRTRGAPRDPMNDHHTDAHLTAWAFGAVRADDPDQTLTRRDLGGLPPTYIDVGSDEVLLDDTLGLFDQLARTQGRATLRVRPGGHLVQLFAARYAPGAESVARAGAWLRAELPQG